MLKKIIMHFRILLHVIAIPIMISHCLSKDCLTVKIKLTKTDKKKLKILPVIQAPNKTLNYKGLYLNYSK